MGLSPIELLIDQAVRDRPIKPRPMVTLRCPVCAKSKSVERHRTDPKRASVVIVQCPDCNDGDFDSPKYLEAAGVEINPATGRPFRSPTPTEQRA